MPSSLLRVSIVGLLSLASSLFAADAPSGLPPLPAPLNAAKPGPRTDAPYAPQPILQGGVVVPLYPPDSPLLNQEKIREPEEYISYGGPLVGAVQKIHNPSIEFHAGHGQLNTGAAIILAAGGGHRTLNVGGESADEVHFFKHHGVSTIILRNRLRSDGYEPKTDGVNDALQAVKLVRAYAKEWKIDPNKIGIMGFSAGGELASSAAVLFEDFDNKNNTPGDALTGITSRPDFVCLVYTGGTPFSRNRTPPPLPRNIPPSFVVTAGSGDQSHAVSSIAYFNAMLEMSLPNIEMHIYGNGRHAGGLADRNDIPFGTWQYRYIDWFRDLGFLQKAGVETKAAQDLRTFLAQPPRPAGGPERRSPAANGGTTTPPTRSN